MFRAKNILRLWRRKIVPRKTMGGKKNGIMQCEAGS